MYHHIDFLIMAMCLFDLVWVFCFVVEFFFFGLVWFLGGEAVEVFFVRCVYF